MRSSIGGPIGEALSALVEHDHARERREPFKQVFAGRELPVELDVRQSARDQHNVARTVAEDAVRDVDAVAPGVFDPLSMALRLLAGRC